MYKDIDVEEALSLEHVSFVDLRSPKEFELDTIPGAINIPLFDNEERKRVGTVYAEQGAREARFLGLEIASPKLPSLIGKLERIKDDHQLILFCWRGGLRSKSIAQILDIMHIPCFRLEGGYRAYRQYVNKFLHENELPHSFVVLHGLTGTGKTEIIGELGHRGYPILDLEGLANHRGSVFGGVGLGRQPSQKWFESQIWAQIKTFTESKLLIVEGESKKIGKLYIPDAVYEGMVKGHRVLVHDTLENRVKRLIKDYVEGAKGDLGEVEEALDYLGRRLGMTKIEELHQLLEAGELERAGIILLQDYYDVLYGKSFCDDAQYDIVIDTRDLGLAIKQIEEYIFHLT